MDKQLINYLAKLSKLSFDDESAEKMATQMQSIIDIMDSIKDLEISADDYAPSFDGDMSALREDTIKESMDPELLLSNSKNKKLSFIAVKKLID